MSTLALPWSRPPISLNDRTHWAAKAAAVRNVRQVVTLLTRGKIAPITGHAEVCLHWQPDVKRKRDIDNVFATLKPCIDGLVQAGVLSGDDCELVTPSARIWPVVKGQKARMWLEIIEIGDDD